MPEYSSRSNDPRVTKGAKKDKYKYDMALEVANQPADTPMRKRMQKDAANYARAFESRFQDEAFIRSGANPLSAGGKGAYKEPQKVDKNSKATKSNVAKKATGAKPKSKTTAASKPKPKIGATRRTMIKRAGKK